MIRMIFFAAAWLTSGVVSAEPAAVDTAISSLDQVVVTASRSGDAVPEKLIGGSVTVLDAETLDQRQTRIVSDVLRDVPGVAVNRTGGIGGLTDIRIRGTEANHVLVLIDGIKASDPYAGAYDFGTLIADDQAKIEVLRGQQSALYGSDAIGGVIQYITLSGMEAPGVRLRAEAGSAGTGSAAARFAGVEGNLDYALSAAALHTDGMPTAIGGARDVRADTGGASIKATWSPANYVRVTAVGRYSYTNADSNNSNTDPTSPQFGLTVDSPGVYFKNTAFYGLLKAELTSFDQHWANAVTLQTADTKRNEYYGSARTGGDVGDRTKGSWESTLKFGTDAVKQRITVALDAEREQFQNLDPSGFGFTGKRHTDNLGVVGQYDVVVNGALAFDASLRRDRNDIFDNANTYRLQASYLFRQGGRVRAAAGSGIKNPDYFELYGYQTGRYIGNPNLKPEKSTGWEAGADQTFLNGSATAGLTYFSSRLKDDILPQYAPPLFLSSPVNLSQDTTQRGLEAFLQARLAARLRVDGAYTYLRAVNDGAPALRRPSSIASLNVTLSSEDGRGEVTATVRYNGRQNDITFTDPTFATQPIVALGSYTLFNIAGEFKLLEHVALIARVENLAGKRYQEVYSFQGTGRAVFGGIRARF